MKTIHSLYVHFPFCRHLCNYCDFYKHQFEGTQQSAQYLEIIENQLGRSKEFLQEHHYSLGQLKTLYFGGGTPSLWGEGIAEFIDRFVDIATDCECTLEVDPGTWSAASIYAAKKAGVNRFSLGVQSFDDAALKALDRIHDSKEVRDTLKFFKGENYSIDFLIGAPVKDRDIIGELERTLEFQPKHLSVYILSTRANYPLKAQMPEDSLVRDEYLNVCSYLENHEFKQYEVSNFALDGYESSHNLNYWKQENVAALGHNATGYLKKSDGALRYQWKSSVPDVTTECLKSDQVKLEKVYMNLRSSIGLKKSLLSDQNKIEDMAKKWQKRGYLKNNEDSIQLNSVGYLMLDSLMDDLFTEGIL